MIKTSFKKFALEIARKRREMTRLQEDLADMLDHLAVIEARAKSANGKRYSTAAVKRALEDLKSGHNYRRCLILR